MVDRTVDKKSSPVRIEHPDVMRVRKRIKSFELNGLGIHQRSPSPPMKPKDKEQPKFGYII